MGKGASFLKESVKYCIPSLASAVVGLVVIPVISNVFPADEYGKINMFYSVGNMLLYIVLLGLDSAYIRFYFEPQGDLNKENIFSCAFWISTILNVALSLTALLFFAEMSGQYLFGEKNNAMLILLAVYVFGLVVVRLLNIESRMEKRAGLFNIQQILLIVTNRISYVAVAFYSTRYTYAIVAITVCTMMIAICCLVYQKCWADLRRPKMDKKSAMNLLAFSIPLMPTTLMTWLNNSLSKMILSGFGDFSAVGILTIGTSLANVFAIIPTAFCVYWSPYMYTNYKKEQGFIKNVHEYVMLLSIVLLIGIYMLQDVLYMFVGGEYKISKVFFMLIMMTPIQTLLCETTSYGIVLSNKTQYNLYISIVAVLLNVAFGAGLYKVLGAMGVALGIAVSAAFQMIVKTVIGQKFYSSILSYKRTIAGMVLIACIAVSNIFVFDRLGIRTMLSVIYIVIVLILYRKQIRDIAGILRGFRK